MSRPYDGTRALGVDPWLANEPDPGTVGRAPRGQRYRCLDCAWIGTSGAKAFDHHCESRHHRVVNRAGIAQQFGCCSELHPLVPVSADEGVIDHE